jgi:hydroxymethylglutaryl-CoA reductase (NADPH)
MSLAAPLVIQGTYAQGEFAVPLCTVEGTLTVSMTRGMLAMAMGGGCRTAHVKQELTRSPFFRMPDLAAVGPFLAWVRDHFGAIQEAAESTTRHGRLLRIDAVPVQDWVILDFVYDTANAAGQNMVTIATEAACHFIEQKTGHRHGIESGYNSDKKPSRRNLMQGRGHSVIAEATLPPNVLAFLGITAQQAIAFQEVATTCAQTIGMLGTNLHLANALTAIYLATGQDAACVAENCVGYSLVTPTPDGGLLARVTLPSLTVGTVGGGTRLPAQRRNLELLGCAEGQYASRKLAEIVAGAALGLEISLLAALVSNQFAAAHSKYGRPKGTC